MSIICAFCGDDQGFSAYDFEVNDKTYSLCNECGRLFKRIQEDFSSDDVSKMIRELHPRLHPELMNDELIKYVNIYLNSNGKTKDDVYADLLQEFGHGDDNLKQSSIFDDYKSQYQRKGLICLLSGVRGRRLALYTRKCEIITDVTLGSILTNNATDGRKTIFFSDCVGVQYKRCVMTIGYLQLETASGQMNNASSNAFSENTFTFEPINGITNMLMDEIYDFVRIRIEAYKYKDKDLLNIGLSPFPLLTEKYKEQQELLNRIKSFD